MKRAIAAQNPEDLRDSPRFDVALRVMNHSGDFVERYGRLGINGCYFESPEIHRLGQSVTIRIGLVGLGVEVETRAKVVSVGPVGGQVGVALRFSEVPFETERLIARWLDMMVEAHRQVAVG